ncbi:hypothetical protein ABZ508_14445 [Streptomyces lavendulocolor]|uniref:Uncharacterized protein n=1 Tax=Streptomyces lavendulocolor TaxID=67316 RepID=A0ABV2W4S9_9ACTN|nr:hypothetical protein GCM10018771_19330 [Streptomyces cellulosae]
MKGRSHRLRGIRGAGTSRDRVLLYTLVPLGMFLFALGVVGARTGLTLLPFDPHHIGLQIGGLVVAFIGLRHWQ